MEINEMKNDKQKQKYIYLLMKKKKKKKSEKKRKEEKKRNLAMLQQSIHTCGTRPLRCATNKT